MQYRARQLYGTERLPVSQGLLHSMGTADLQFKKLVIHLTYGTSPLPTISRRLKRLKSLVCDCNGPFQVLFFGMPVLSAFFQVRPRFFITQADGEAVCVFDHFLLVNQVLNCSLQAPVACFQATPGHFTIRLVHSAFRPAV